MYTNIYNKHNIHVTIKLCCVYFFIHIINMFVTYMRSVERIDFKL